MNYQMVNMYSSFMQLYLKSTKMSNGNKWFQYQSSANYSFWHSYVVLVNEANERKKQG